MKNQQLSRDPNQGENEGENKTTREKPNDAGGPPGTRSPGSPPASQSSWFGLGTLLSVLSLLSVALASLGYGMSLAVETMFGIPHATVFASVFELVDLSGLVIVAIVNATELLLDPRTLLAHLSGKLWVLLAVLLVLWLAALLAIVPGWRLPLQRREKLRPRAWLAMPRPGDSWWQMFKSLAWPVLAFVGLTFVFWTGLMAACALAATMALLPVLGYEVGQRQLQQWVVEADVCRPRRSAAQRIALANRKAQSQAAPPSAEKRRGVVCVSLVRDKETLITGRVVIASPSAIVVYDPATGAVQRESLDGLSVRAAEL